VAGSGIDEARVRALVVAALRRWPAVGLAAVVVRPAAPAWFHFRGLADISSRRPVGEDTAFRVASISKTFTAIAVMQLAERGVLDLDAPAARYLRAYRLVPAGEGFPPVTIRHLLTHTGGIPMVRRLSDFARPMMGWGAPPGQAPPALGEYYGGGLRVEVPPGTTFAYGNHGFATLGQIVEDTTGAPLGGYLREHVLGPLGMDRSDLGWTERSRRGRATGYALRARGPVPVAAREPTTPGAASVCATPGDMARYLAALAGGGGAALRPGALADMMRPHHRADPRVPGMGLGVFLGDVAGVRTAGHDGVLPGFLSQMLVAPERGVGVLVMVNTGGLSGRGAPVWLADALLREVLGLPADGIRGDLPDRPEAWGELCGAYAPGPGFLVGLPTRATLGPVARVAVRRGHLVLSGASPASAVRHGLRLHPDDESDPDVLRVDLSRLGLGTSRVVFGRGPDGAVDGLHLGAAPISLRRRRERPLARRRAARAGGRAGRRPGVASA
jgi:CubicO group peptidase (beta-lactamase class C family)